MGLFFKRTSIKSEVFFTMNLFVVEEREFVLLTRLKFGNQFVFGRKLAGVSLDFYSSAIN